MQQQQQSLAVEMIVLHDCMGDWCLLSLEGAPDHRMGGSPVADCQPGEEGVPTVADHRVLPPALPVSLLAFPGGARATPCALYALPMHGCFTSEDG